MPSTSGAAISILHLLPIIDIKEEEDIKTLLVLIVTLPLHQSCMPPFLDDTDIPWLALSRGLITTLISLFSHPDLLLLPPPPPQTLLPIPRYLWT